MADPAINLPSDITPVSPASSDVPSDIEVVPKEPEAHAPESGFKRAARFIGGTALPVAGALGGGALGAISPIPGGALIGESAGGAAMEALAQKLGLSDPSKTSIALTALAPGAGRLLSPAFKLGREAIVKTFAGRDVVAQAAESLLQKWFAPQVSAQVLYDTAAATKAIIPYRETSTAVNDLVQKELKRLPLPTQKEILDVLDPIRQEILPKIVPGKPAVTAATGVLDASGNPIMRTVTPAIPAKQIPLKSAPVADAMAEVRRLRTAATTAYRTDSDVGNAINKVRAALLNDLEASGVPEVKLASKAARKEMAIEDLSSLIAKPNPTIKIADYARKNPLFKGAFSAREMEQINRIAEKISKFTPSGGAGVVGQVATTAAGEMLGGTAGAAGGWLAPHLIRNLLATEYGRNVTERVLAAEIKPGPRSMAILASIARSLGSQEMQKHERDEYFDQ